MSVPFSWKFPAEGCFGSVLCVDPKQSTDFKPSPSTQGHACSKIWVTGRPLLPTVHFWKMLTQIFQEAYHFSLWKPVFLLLWSQRFSTWASYLPGTVCLFLILGLFWKGWRWLTTNHTETEDLWHLILSTLTTDIKQLIQNWNSLKFEPLGTLQAICLAMQLLLPSLSPRPVGPCMAKMAIPGLYWCWKDLSALVGAGRFQTRLGMDSWLISVDSFFLLLS